jgi:hypothetical protein
MVCFVVAVTHLLRVPCCSSVFEGKQRFLTCWRWTNPPPPASHRFSVLISNLWHHLQPSWCQTVSCHVFSQLKKAEFWLLMWGGGGEKCLCEAATVVLGNDLNQSRRAWIMITVCVASVLVWCCTDIWIVACVWITQWQPDCGLVTHTVCCCCRYVFVPTDGRTAECHFSCNLCVGWRVRVNCKGWEGRGCSDVWIIDRRPISVACLPAAIVALHPVRGMVLAKMVACGGTTGESRAGGWGLTWISYWASHLNISDTEDIFWRTQHGGMHLCMAEHALLT